MPYYTEAKLGAIRKQDKYRIASAEMIFIRRMSKYTWLDYKTNKDISSVPKINPVVNKTQNYINKLVQHVRRMDRDRQTDRLPHSIMNYEPCGK